eukprot:PhM_4_TR1979/c0_g1_i1/m.43778
MSNMKTAGLKGEISEIDRSLGLFKIKFVTDEETVYEVQNRSMKTYRITFFFFDLTNIRFLALDPEVRPEEPTAEYPQVFSVLVRANTTMSFLGLSTVNADEAWTYNYEIKYAEDDSPAWLQ